MRVAVTTVRSVEQTEPFLTAADALEKCQSAMVPIRVEEAGQVQEYRLCIEAPARLIIAGAGHVGAAVAKLAIDLDFQVTVIDDRADLAGADRFPSPIRPVVGDIEQTLRAQELGPRTFVVIVTRGHHHDEQALSAVIDSDAAYIGMIGSRRKVKLIFDDLVAAGVAPDRLQRVHAPIGLSIGGVTVPEIALSIVAELVQVRRAEKPTRVEGPLAVSQQASSSGTEEGTP